MQFNIMRGVVLANVGKYEASPDTNTELIVGLNINLAIKDIIQNILTEKLTVTDTITTEDRSSSLSPTYTMSTTSVVEVMKMRYISSEGNWDLDKVNYQSLRQRVSDLEETGRPSVYLPKGNTAGKSKFDLHPITAYQSETIEIEYKPILTDLSGTQENIVTIRYPSEVIEIATKRSRRNISNEKVTEEEMVTFILAITDRINSKEQSPPDYRYNRLVPDVLIARRKSRRTV